MVLVTVSCGWAVNAFFSHYQPPQILATADLEDHDADHENEDHAEPQHLETNAEESSDEEHHSHEMDSSGTLNLAALIALGLALLSSLYRQGPQGFLGHVFSQNSDPDGCGPDHE